MLFLISMAFIKEDNLDLDSENKRAKMSFLKLKKIVEASIEELTIYLKIKYKLGYDV